eukprot:TRINITY_DN65478_c0_g1_i1.p1 TRINITY_DN65478_c0_g1~~TRINITY_DN65478_c0_g1_i1.p1  ORF type:complete len:298 (+),score=44.76 TRINITY_DN65478_c0_g1_i1:213-1106(+)
MKVDCVTAYLSGLLLQPVIRAGSCFSSMQTALEQVLGHRLCNELEVFKQLLSILGVMEIVMHQWGQSLRIENYRWELIGQDFARIVKAVTKRYGRAPDACVTHSFSGDCFLMELAERPIDVGRMILLDPVLSDKDGATTGAQRLAKGTRRLGEKEADGWDSAEAVGNSLERTLRVSLDSESKAAFARFCSAPDADGRWRLKCSRENEACGYENRVALADHLETKDIHADVHLIFSERRRAAPEDQAAVFERDWKEAERVVGRCHSGAVHLLPGVGHFLVLEAPSLVAETIEGLLPKK